TDAVGLTDNDLNFVIEDGQGYLWIGSDSSLMRVSKKSLNDFAKGTLSSIQCHAYGPQDGLPTAESAGDSQPAACRTRDGRLLFPTTRGLAYVNPAELVPNTNPPPVVIESAVVEGEPSAAEGLLSPAPRTISIPANRERLDIRYSSLNLAAPGKVRFRYRLAGHEARWTEVAGNIRTVTYSKLPHGHYQFEVQACNEDGWWNTAGASLGVTVLPPFWQTWWFIGGSLLCVLGIVSSAVHYVSTQRLHRQLEGMRRQQALENERSRIARDIHDQVGASLTQVSLLGEMVESDKDLPGEVEAHARQISQTARATSRALDEIVWTVNPSNDTLEGLVNYLCKYAQEYLAVAGLRYRLEAPPDLPAA